MELLKKGVIPIPIIVHSTVHVHVGALEVQCIYIVHIDKKPRGDPLPLHPSFFSLVLRTIPLGLLSAYMQGGLGAGLGVIDPYNWAS